MLDSGRSLWEERVRGSRAGLGRGRRGVGGYARKTRGLPERRIGLAQIPVARKSWRGKLLSPQEEGERKK